MANKKEESVRIQTSVLNDLEKKVLLWLAQRQPSWMTSDILTFIGTCGSVLIAAGYILSARDVNWLWLSTFGFAVNWYGDSLDGTLARYRNCQRPVYGYYIDHTVDAVNEFIMFLGVGLSGLMHLELALLIFALYLMLTINVSINAHLRKEFRLTYAGMGPTEFRLIMMLVNTLFIFIRPLNEFSHTVSLFGHVLVFKALDYVAVVIFAVFLIMYSVTIISDARWYARNDPPRKQS